MKSFRLNLLSLLSALLFLSSCASVFEGRNYSHLNYVKAKKEQKESSDQQVIIPQNQKEEIQQLVSKAEHGITIDAQESVPQQKKVEKKNSGSSSSASVRQNEVSPNESHAEDMVMKKLAPFISEKQRKKIEAKTDQLFSGLDSDLRIALIFGIAGLIAVLIGALLYGAPPLGEIFYVIGVILIIIGLAYLIKYLVENG